MYGGYEEFRVPLMTVEELSRSLCHSAVDGRMVKNLNMLQQLPVWFVSWVYTVSIIHVGSCRIVLINSRTSEWACQARGGMSLERSEARRGSEGLPQLWGSGVWHFKVSGATCYGPEHHHMAAACITKRLLQTPCRCISDDKTRLLLVELTPGQGEH